MARSETLKADLHVHSVYSERPSEWILKTLGTKESYTDPQYIYRSAKERGMDLVTITDHNRLEGALILKESYPEDELTGIEVTSYFPDSRAKIHVLVYGLNEGNLLEIDRLRGDLFDLRDYLLQEDLAHSVAHATFSINKKLRYPDLERLILLFDVFEAINGNCTYIHNHTWYESLRHLDPDRIEDLYRRHRIEPASRDPWRKGFTGGSDDHAGLFIGTTFTQAPAVDPETFLRSLKDKRTTAAGRHNDFHNLAFSIYKIAYDFSKDKGIRFSQPLLNNLNELLFEGRNVSFLERLYLKQLSSRYGKRNERTRKLVLDTLHNSLLAHGLTLEERIDRLYEAIAVFSDDFFRAILESIAKDFSKLDLINLLRKVSSSLFGVFLLLPFFSTIKHMFQDRDILERLEREFLPYERSRDRRILWFTDTISNLNGVSVTLQKIGWMASRRNKDLTLVSCLLEVEKTEGLPPNLMLLPQLYHFVPKFYDRLTIKIPSILKSLKIIYEMRPEEIVISTPGPVGLMGLLAAKLMAVRVKGIYHSDFAGQIGSMIQDEYTNPFIDGYQRWFYNLCDEILVPTRQYMRILAARGFDEAKMRLFSRGIDISHYNFKESGESVLRNLAGLDGGITLLYAGRIAKDKNLEFLSALYLRLRKRFPGLNMVFAGDGPYLEEFRASFDECAGVYFVGRLDQNVLPYVYSGADLLVFPGTVDTFGMVVLEAQACGLPAVVADVGGPQEIIADGETGLVAKADDLEDWELKLSRLIEAAAGGD